MIAVLTFSGSTSSPPIASVLSLLSELLEFFIVLLLSEVKELFPELVLNSSSLAYLRGLMRLWRVFLKLILEIFLILVIWGNHLIVSEANFLKHVTLSLYLVIRRSLTNVE